MVDVEMGDGGEPSVEEGAVVRDIRFLDKAGLRPTDALYVRNASVSLWQALESRSCAVQGPPGVGKSTTIWVWLLHKVSAMDSKSNCRALWCHFRPHPAPPTFTVITITAEGGLEFKSVKPSLLLKEEKFAVCVMDGVREENKKEVSKYGAELDYGQMVWVTSQQVVIPQETLLELGWDEICYPSWTRDEIDSYVLKMSEEEKTRIIADFNAGMAGRLDDDKEYAIDDVVNIKHWFFGGSARYMFGLPTQKALADIKNHTEKIEDVEQVFRGLTGSRGRLAVNHIIAHFPNSVNEENEFCLLSSYVIELLSKKMGFAAIKMFYRSSWVRGNPSVHGFVFEWDLFTQIQQNGSLSLSSGQESGMDTTTTWRVDQSISLKDFLAGKGTTGRTMVRPEKWNHPEYDGLYIYTNHQGQKELVAWNASEAKQHTGSVTKLRVLLQTIGNRAQKPLVFERVRFIFIVPTEDIASFRLPSASQTLLASQQLKLWHFPGFEVLGGNRTVEEY